jgi:adenine-specific DNA-methyltransferase
VAIPLTTRNLTGGFAGQRELFCSGSGVSLATILLTEADIISAAAGLGADQVKPLSDAERALLQIASTMEEGKLAKLRNAIHAGADPLGDAFCRLRTAERRRGLGATYTPKTIVNAMLRWSKHCDIPLRIVDPGTGSARFLVACGKVFKNAHLVGYEIDPLSALTARANLAAWGYGARSEVLLRDYRSAKLPEIKGSTLFIGNPPYVRHHLIEPQWKTWLSDTAGSLGYRASQLAGLHVHFFLATVAHAKAGDFGIYITAAEWLDVNYGNLMREMFLDRLGGQFITVVEPTARVFQDAATTAAITGFVIDSHPKTIRVSRIADTHDLGSLSDGKEIHRARLEASRRWSHLTRRPTSVPEGFVELGELCRVHRGQVTGSNRVWIAGQHSNGIPERFLFRTITRAKELFAAGPALTDASHLRDVIDLPTELDELPLDELREVERFLRYARGAGAHKSYIANNRKAWWSVRLREPAPILATYMARRPPAFVRNIATARHLNIAHGLYPREEFGAVVLDHLASFLSKTVSIIHGRTYQGGLTKFEPREMERLFVPGPDLLRSVTI